MRPLAVLLLISLLIPSLIAAGVTELHHAAVQTHAGAPQVTLSGGDIGTPTIGASASSATVSIGTLPLLVANDALRITTTSPGWTVHAEFIDSSGFTGLLEEITIRLTAGATSQTQIRDSYLGLLQASGTQVPLEPDTPVEMRLIGQGTGSLSLELILVPTTGIEIRYPITVTVG